MSVEKDCGAVDGCAANNCAADDCATDDCLENKSAYKSNTCGADEPDLAACAPDAVAP